jgi:hypothetical protein
MISSRTATYPSYGSQGSPALGSVNDAMPLVRSNKGNYTTQEAAPQPDVANRKVVTNSNFSLLVKNVTETIDKIKAQTLLVSGYMVNSYITSSEYGETANIQIRIPSDKVEEFSKYMRTLAVKVVSENIDGHDITDQYMDIERRLSDLEAQRVRMQTILDKATTVSEMLEVQNALFQIQDQIDSYKGQLLYMDGTTETSLLTIYVSTDELGLPYTPAKPWVPEAIFKQAVRSLVGTLQKIGTLAIWTVVFSPLILTVYVVVKVVKRIRRKHANTTQNV